MTNNYVLGQLIEQTNRVNSELKYSINDVMGITNTKELMETKARVEYADLSKFNIVYPHEFIYNPRTSRNGEKVGMAYNTTNHNILFTFNNIPFRVKKEAEKILDSDYLYLFFLNPEFDRYARFKSWGSATELFLWKDMCEIEIVLPELHTQKKIVEDYKIIIDRIKELRSFNLKLINMMFCQIKASRLIKNVSLNQVEGFNEIASGIAKFNNCKNYIATGDVDFDMVQNTVQKVNYFDRPSRANMSPKYKSIWFAKMQNTQKILYFDEENEEINNIILSTGFEGIRCSNEIFYYILAYIYSDEFEVQKSKYATGTTQIAINSDALSKIQIPIVENYNELNKKFEIMFDNLKVNNKEISKLLKLKEIMLLNVTNNMEV